MENISGTGDAGESVLTYGDVLNAVRHGQDPTEISRQVQCFLQQNPNMSGQAKAAIANAVYERNKLERQKNNDGGAKRMRLDWNFSKRERPWLQLEISTSNDNSNTQLERNPPVADPIQNNSSNNPPPKSAANPAIDLLKRICLNRQSLEKIERFCGAQQFARLRKLLLGCLVVVNVQGENLVAEINNVEDHMQYGRNVHFDRRLFLQPFGYFDFQQVSDQLPTEEEIQYWIQQRKLPLPGLDFLHSKIAKLKPILMSNHHAMNGSTAQASGEGTSSAGTSGDGKGTQNSADDDENEDIAKIVHSLETLIQSLLPSEQFLGILAVRNKFPLRVDTICGCLVAYRILGDPGNRVYISEISQIDAHSVQFKHRPGAVEFANLLPVLEERDVDEDLFGDWLEEMENWNEPLPELRRLTGKMKYAMDMIKQTLQPRPPLDSNEGYTHRDLLVRPEQIAQLWSGLDREEFAEVISGMFVTFDFSELNCTIATVNGKGNRRYVKPNFRSKHNLFLPISEVTFDAPTATPVPFLPHTYTSNARLHIDSSLCLYNELAKWRGRAALPIPQTEEVLSLQHFMFCRSVLERTSYEFPSMDYVEAKVKRLWQALEKAKTAAGGVQKQEPTNGCVPMEIEEQ